VDVFGEPLSLWVAEMLESDIEEFYKREIEKIQLSSEKLKKLPVLPLWRAEQILDEMESRGEPMPEVRVTPEGWVIIVKKKVGDLVEDNYSYPSGTN
jgi:hypothetical protein